MADIFRTLIVPDSFVALARRIAASFGPDGEGMWTTPLAPPDTNTPTHYISSGYIPEEFVNMMPSKDWSLNEDGEWIVTSSTVGNPVLIYTLVTENGVECTQEDIDALFSFCDITAQEPFTAMSRLNLNIVNNEVI